MILTNFHQAWTTISLSSSPSSSSPPPGSPLPLPGDGAFSRCSSPEKFEASGEETGEELEEAAVLGRKRVGRVESLRRLLGGWGGRRGEEGGALPAPGAKLSTLERHDPWAFVKRPLHAGGGGGGMRYKRCEERVRRKREVEAMMLRGEEGREKSQSMGNLVLEGRCRASKSEESGYDSDTRRSLEVLSGRRGEEEVEEEEPHYQVPRRELVVVENRPDKPPRGRREEEVRKEGGEGEEEPGREEIRGRRGKGVMRSHSQPARGRPLLSHKPTVTRNPGPAEHLMVRKSGMRKVVTWFSFQVLRINKGPTNELGIIITGTRNPSIIKSASPHKIRHEHTISGHRTQT